MAEKISRMYCSNKNRSLRRVWYSWEITNVKYSPGTGDGKSSGIIGLYRTEENGPNDHWLVLALSFFIKFETRFLLVLATKVIPSLCSYIYHWLKGHIFWRSIARHFLHVYEQSILLDWKLFPQKGWSSYLFIFIIYHLSFIVN